MLSSPTVRIGVHAHRTLRALAQQSHRSMQRVLDDAIEREQRRQFFEGIKTGYAELRADPQAWKEYQTELRAWDVTLLDGLDPNETWAPPKRAKRSR